MWQCRTQRSPRLRPRDRRQPQMYDLNLNTSSNLLYTMKFVLIVSSDMKVGDVVSVFSDLEGRCTRGALSFQGNKVFVGNGVAEMDRSSIFCTDEHPRF